LPTQAAAGIHQLTPELAPFPEAIIAAAIAKTQKDTQSQPHHSKRQRSQCKLEPTLDVQTGQKGRKQSGCEHPSPDHGKNTAPDLKENPQPTPFFCVNNHKPSVS
jgi:hypothetical protein